MNLPPQNSYSWESLETTTLVLPNELLVYYLYKYNLDVKAKKESAIKEDLCLIDYYTKVLQREKEVAVNVFQNNR